MTTRVQWAVLAVLLAVALASLLPGVLLVRNDRWSGIQPRT
jgi:hypothetical protein